MAQDCCRNVSFFKLLGCLMCLSSAFVRADGRLFLLEARNGSGEADGAAAAQEACARHGARLATAAQLRHAVVECSFATCTRGWLAGPGIGVTVCSELGGGQQAMKTVDVKVENVTAFSSHLDIFCMKDQGCGDPPTFAHTVLQSHTGLELGEELLYVCAPGFIMAGGQSAFSLLCDSCGEWYGLVQPCGKDKVETQVDYEIPDEGHASYEDVERTGGAEETSFGEGDGLVPRASSSELEQEQDGRPGEEMSMAEHQAGGLEDGNMEDATEKIGYELTAGTDAPVSLLSQKHLFWFPSETFHEPDRPGIPGVTVAPAWVEDEDNHIAVKASGSETDSVKAHGQRDSVPLNTVKLNYTRVGVRGPRPEADESWLDGYPVTQETGEEEEEEGGVRDAGIPTTETTEDDEIGRKVPSRTERMDGSQPDHGSPAPSSDSAHIAVPPTRPADYGVKHIPVRLTPRSSLESVHMGLHPSTRHSIAVHTPPTATTPAPPELDLPGHPADRGDGRKVKMGPTAPWHITKSLYPFLDHLPGPTQREDVTVPYQKVPSGTVATDMIDEFPGTGLNGDSVERNLTWLGPEAGGPPTEGPCLGEGCPLAGRGPVVAIVIVAACALMVAAVLAVWCYKKQQQKSSVYKMNGKDQGRPAQQIEMQQKV
ncbi:sushi domain-containing protein 5 isoform X1 [Paramormyrops kingsleyae]|uniref:sushi domain-containing protein 5 isoform X1 n=2 Tax=Paramormyrops kingsleyae TaxID=1676925 RepID=UPI000CD66BC4|nr:sushi domain-containing protein 5 isoform X1 [Paramormyrops kingsleyae]